MTCATCLLAGFLVTCLVCLGIAAKAADRGLAKWDLGRWGP